MLLKSIDIIRILRSQGQVTKICCRDHHHVSKRKTITKIINVLIKNY